METSNHFTTMKSVITSPAGFFKTFPENLGYKKPIIFFIINTVITVLISALVALLMGSNNQQFGLVLTSMIVLIPMMLVFLFIGAGILHLSAKILRGKGKYVNSFQVLSYTSAITPLTALPFIGIFASLYQMYVVIIGFKKVHQYSTVRAVITVLLPVLVILVVVLALVAVVGVAIFKYFGATGLNPQDLQNLENMQNIQSPEDLKKILPSVMPSGVDYPVEFPTGYEDYQDYNQ